MLREPLTQLDCCIFSQLNMYKLYIKKNNKKTFAQLIQLAFLGGNVV